MENFHIRIISNLNEEIKGLKIGLNFNLNQLNQMKKMYLKKTALLFENDTNFEIDLKIRLETVKTIVQAMLLKLRITKNEYKERLKDYNLFNIERKKNERNIIN